MIDKTKCQREGCSARATAAFLFKYIPVSEENGFPPEGVWTHLGPRWWENPPSTHRRGFLYSCEAHHVQVGWKALEHASDEFVSIQPITPCRACNGTSEGPEVRFETNDGAAITVECQACEGTGIDGYQSNRALTYDSKPQSPGFLVRGQRTLTRDPSPWRPPSKGKVSYEGSVSWDPKTRKIEPIPEDEARALHSRLLRADEVNLTEPVTIDENGVSFGDPPLVVAPSKALEELRGDDEVCGCGRPLIKTDGGLTHTLEDEDHHLAFFSGMRIELPPNDP